MIHLFWLGWSIVHISGQFWCGRGDGVRIVENCGECSNGLFWRWWHDRRRRWSLWGEQAVLGKRWDETREKIYSMVPNATPSTRNTGPPSADREAMIERVEHLPDSVETLSLHQCRAQVIVRVEAGQRKREM